MLAHKRLRTYIFIINQLKNQKNWFTMLQISVVDFDKRNKNSV